MSSQRFVEGLFPERYVEVDAARLLLILTRFARPIDNHVATLRYRPPRPVEAYFTPEYYLQKLDFLLRYPGYFIYELIELHRMGITAEIDRDETIAIVRTVLHNNEPELMTTLFRRFWYGTYERLDDVEGWWYGHELVYTRPEPRSGLRPQKYYFLTALAFSEADRLVREVSHGRWYADRVALIHRFFGRLSAAEVKQLQYSHQSYRQAQLNETIPDISYSEIAEHFANVFHEPLEEHRD